MTRRTFILGLSYLTNGVPNVKKIDFTPENIVKFKDSKWVLIVHTRLLGIIYIDPTSFTSFTQSRKFTKFYAGDYAIETIDNKPIVFTDYSRFNSDEVMSTEVKEIYFQQV